MMSILDREDTQALENSLKIPLNPQNSSDLSDLDDDIEVQNMLAVSTEEIEFKKMLWMDENKEWLQIQEAKQKQEECQLKPQMSKSNAKHTKKKLKRDPRWNSPAASAAEAAKNLINSKPTLSKKINYTILENLVCFYTRVFILLYFKLLIMTV
jgi:transcription factor IIIB subunit 2